MAKYLGQLFFNCKIICIQSWGNSFCHGVSEKNSRVVWNGVSGSQRALKKGVLKDGWVACQPQCAAGGEGSPMTRLTGPGHGRDK